MNVALALYAVIAGLFLMLSLDEGRRKQLPWDGHRLLGIALSLAWPVTIAVAAIAVFREAPWKRRAK